MSFDSFIKGENSEGLVAGTIMSLQEKKSAKGTPFAIIRFSDNRGEFELFLFSENLIKNRNKLKESESFVMTLQKDRNINTSQIRVNVKKILSLDEIINKPYSKITLELKENFDVKELSSLFKEKGETKVKMIFKNKNKKISYYLENPRKFNFNQLKVLKNKEYVKKISV